MKKAIGKGKAKKTAIKPAKSYTKKIQMFKKQDEYFALNEKYSKLGFATRAIHCGSEPSQEFRGVSVPLDFSSTFA